MTRQQKKKEKRNAAAAGIALPSSSAPADIISPTLSSRPTPPHSTPAPVSPSPSQQHSPGSTSPPSLPKQAGSPQLSTPPQSVVEPLSQKSSRSTTRPPSQPVPRPSHIAAYRSTAVVLPATTSANSKTHTEGKAATFSNSMTGSKSASKAHQGSGSTNKPHDRATSPPTPGKYTSTDRQKAPTTPKSLNHSKIGSNSLAQEMETLVSHTVRRAKVATKSPASPSFWAAVTTPLVGPKMAFAALLDRYPADHARRAELNKLRVGSPPYRFYRSIRGESHTDPQFGGIFHDIYMHKCNRLMLPCKDAVCAEASTPTFSCLQVRPPSSPPATPFHS